MARRKIAPSHQMQLFDDPDLKKPEHDDIQYWIQEVLRTSPERFEQFVEKPVLEPCFGDVWIKKDGEETQWCKPLYGGDPNAPAREFLCPLAHARVGEPPDIPPVEVAKVTWEWPLYAPDRNRRQIGYVDLCAAIRFRKPVGYAVVETTDVSPEVKTGKDHITQRVPRQGAGILGEAAAKLNRVNGTIGVIDGSIEVLQLSRSSYRQNDDFRQETEAWLDTNGEPLIDAMGNYTALDGSYHYLITEAGWKLEHRDLRLFIEVKTNVPSIGELIRQLRFYVTHGASPLVVVAPPDDRLAVTLQEQGFGYVPYMPQ